MINVQEFYGHQNVYKKVRFKKKGRFHPTTGHEGSDGQYRYSSTLSLTLALHWDGWLMPDPGRFIPGEDTQYPLCRRLGGSSGLSGKEGKISPSPVVRTQTVQAVWSHYTD